MFKELLTHRKNSQTWEVRMKWDDDYETWEAFSVIWKSDQHVSDN